MIFARRRGFAPDYESEVADTEHRTQVLRLDVSERPLGAWRRA